MLRLIAAFFFMALPTWADSWVHLASPPNGKVFVELKSDTALSPVLLAGTLSPPTLTMNGQKVPLKVGESKNEKGLWINGRSYPTEDVMGRFFAQLEGSDAAVETLNVTLETGDGKVHEASIQLNRIFLEAPIEKKLILNSENETKTFQFQISGTIPGQFDMKISGKRLNADADGLVEVPINLAPGKSTLTIEFKRKESSKRIINLPLVVTKTGYDQEKQILSFEIPFEKDRGLNFRGVTNPGGTLSANGTPIKVEPDGKFDWLFKSDQPKGNIQFLVQTPNEGEKKYAYAYECASCGAKSESAPVKRKSLTFHVTEISSFVFSGDSLPGKVITSYSRFDDMKRLALTYSHELSNGFFAQIAVAQGGMYQGDDGDTYIMYVSNPQALSVGFSYEMTKRAFGGLSLTAYKAKLQGKGFTATPEEISSIGLEAFLEGDFKFADRWSFAPKITITGSGLSFIKNEAPASWLFFSIQLIGIRHWF